VSGPSLNSPRYRGALYMLLVSGLCWGLSSTSAVAQSQGEARSAKNVGGSSQTDEDQSADPKTSTQNDTPPKNEPEARGAFVVAPLPISSPALGSGIVPVFPYIFPFNRNDKISPASTLGAAGLVTDNGSRAFVLAGELYFKEDTYRTTAGFARGNLDYSLYGLGDGASQLKLPRKQTGQALFGEFLHRLWWRFFLGPRFSWGSSLITLKPSDKGNVPLPPDIGLHTALTALGFHLERDTRPNRFYPTTGTLFDFASDFYSQGLGSKYSFQSYKLTFNKYWSLSKSQVLAYNSFGCATGGQPPFYGNCIYGTQNELRGYTAGRYLSRYMVATQLEYRLALPKRFGVVAYGGLGEVIPGATRHFGTRTSCRAPAGD
jgi:Omp85 superfamily domain